MCYAKARCLSATKGSKGVKLQACHSNSPSRKRKVEKEGQKRHVSHCRTDGICLLISRGRIGPPNRNVLRVLLLSVTHHVLHFLRLGSNSFPKMIPSHKPAILRAEDYEKEG